MYEFICKNGNKILSEVELPRWGDHGEKCKAKKGSIKWSEIVGMRFKLTYDGNEYDVKIVVYDKDKRRLYVDCNGFIKEDGIFSGDFANGSFGGIINVNPNTSINGKMMYACSDNVKILAELPYRQSKINRQDMVGMSFDVEYYGVVYKCLKILEYIEGCTQFFNIEFDGDVSVIQCSDFLNGNLGNILNIDLNYKYIKNDVLYINIKNKDGREFLATYTGKHIKEVMKSNWGVALNNRGRVLRVSSNKYNNKTCYLHRVDFEHLPSHIVIDHIDNNPLNNCIENLRPTTRNENCKNKSMNNSFGTIGVKKSKNGWYSSFKYNNHSVNTQVKYNFEEAKLDNLITQRYLGYKHNEDLFYLLNNLPQKRIKEVTDLLDVKIENNKSKILKPKVYKHDIEDRDVYYVLHKNGKEMLFDCGLGFVKSKTINNTKGYWVCMFVENNMKVQNSFHKELLGLRANEYKEYNLQVDHLNGNPSDNRYSNLAITTRYSNQCNKQGKGYEIKKNSLYQVICMSKYKYWYLIGRVKIPTFQTEQEAIDEVNRRREIIDNARVKLKSKEELETLIQYCLENGHTQENGLADLDLGYLYWKGILKRVA